MDLTLLRQLCQIHAPAGNEAAMSRFVQDYVALYQHRWAAQPTLLAGPQFQDCVLLVFGQPRTAVFAHMDSIGFTTRYENQLVPIGGPEVKDGWHLTGQDSLGPIACQLKVEEDEESGRKKLSHNFGRPIERGTELVFAADWRETEEYVQCCYMDNRLGMFNAMKLCETLEHGIIAFSCWEEVGGGSVPFLIRHIYEKYGVQQALVSDITWVTDGVKPGEGCAISMRDRNLPRRSYISKIIAIAEAQGIPYQLEVEAGGSSDGRELQQSPYPIDWAFVGAAEQHVHSPNEKVHKADIAAMLNLYQALMETL